MPIMLARQIKNLAEFVSWLDEDQQALFVKNFNLPKEDPNYQDWVKYKGGLTLKMQKNEKFSDVLEKLQELRLGAN